MLNYWACQDRVVIVSVLKFIHYQLKFLGGKESEKDGQLGNPRKKQNRRVEDMVFLGVLKK